MTRMKSGCDQQCRSTSLFQTRMGDVVPMSCAVCGSGKKGAVVGRGYAQPEDVEHP